MSKDTPTIEAIKHDLKDHQNPPSYRIEYRYNAAQGHKERVFHCECGNKSRNDIAYRRHIAPFLRAVFWVNYLGLDMTEMSKS